MLGLTYVVRPTAKCLGVFELEIVVIKHFKSVSQALGETVTSFRRIPITSSEIGPLLDSVKRAAHGAIFIFIRRVGERGIALRTKAFFHCN